jgi:Flp pilus assembly pilin Flp
LRLHDSRRNRGTTMRRMVRSIGARLVRDDAAQGMAEYALLAGLIAVVAIAAVTLLGGNINTTLNNIATAIGGAGS